MGVEWGRSLEGSGLTLVCSPFRASGKPPPRPQHIMDGMREKETQPCLQAQGTPERAELGI